MGQPPATVSPPASLAPTHAQQLKTLNRRLRRQIYDLHNLFQISLELTSIRDQDTLLFTFLVNLIGLAGCEGGTILLRSPESGTFEPAITRGLSPHVLKRLTFPGKHPVVTEFEKERKPRPIVERAGDDGAMDALNGLCRLGVSLIAPIADRQSLLGLAVLGARVRGTPYTEPDIEIISLLNNFAAMVFSNVALYEKMERLSTTDPLTGLHNRRSFEKILHNELTRAQRFGQPLSLAMIDVDHFKNLNDTVGHPAGDRLLCVLATIMERTVRGTDYVARYGGEEFAIILPGVEQQGAFRLCERLRNSIANHEFENRQIQPGGRITASFGSASFPLNAIDAHSLVAKADAALYCAKRRGRNQTVLYSVDQERHQEQALASMLDEV